MLRPVFGNIRETFSDNVMMNLQLCRLTVNAILYELRVNVARVSHIEPPSLEGLSWGARRGLIECRLTNKWWNTLIVEHPMLMNPVMSEAIPLCA